MLTAMEETEMTDQAPGQQSHQPEPPRLRSVFTLFFRIGLTAFGGPAMIPVIRAAVVERLRWLRKEEFRLGLSLC